ncbi:MAG: hypothetical protein GWO08_01640 [Gammaproteobacteria bacterium]|nr:hypothetical protein [candidate division Zixibacteria bacterium]NIR62280.1 hypothetical protein [candidate division Zixibacteria bacterium]NIR92409.1 hypothetical protein [Gammaproteobacteria bacterium]NIS44515.1 hypothetical protein [candidate division Zixibacteria bacterium]NIU12530.1 hypothetical protein [candidate division Zixibacteria bacterium]
MREHIVRDITVEGKSQFDSGPLKSGDIFAFTFSQPQSYKYECSADGSLIGSITVSVTPAPSVIDNSNQVSSSGNEPNWKKYTNEEVGFRIEYPSYWQVEDLPEENQGQMHHIILTGPEGGVELIWGTGLGGACPEGYQPIAVAKGNWPVCHIQKEDGTDQWSLAGQPVGETDFSGLVYTNDTTDKSREIVLQVIATLSFSAEQFSSDQLGLCFSYPQGYSQIPYNDSVQIAAPDIPGSDVKGLFWLEISGSDNRTAEEVADQELTYVPGLDVGRWIVELGGEQALVLDGMPGQELQRRVYIVREQILYILAFWPSRSENKTASDQMESLYAAVTSSWEWSPCSARE